MIFPHFLDTVIESIVQWLELDFVQAIPWADAIGTAINNIITTMCGFSLTFFWVKCFSKMTWIASSTFLATGNILSSMYYKQPMLSLGVVCRKRNHLLRKAGVNSAIQILWFSNGNKIYGKLKQRQPNPPFVLCVHAALPEMILGRPNS